MATATNVSATFRMTDNNKKVLCSFNRVNPEVTAEKLDSFYKGVDTLRVKKSGKRYLIVTSLLAQ